VGGEDHEDFGHGSTPVHVWLTSPLREGVSGLSCSIMRVARRCRGGLSAERLSP
jgi:hypothetical protein